MKRILSVGQCGYDHAKIAKVLRRDLKADVSAAESAAETMSLLKTTPFDLVLVNRILDEDGSSGLDLIRQIKHDPTSAALPVMLVSNYPEAQQQAGELGAILGFGKAEVASPSVVDRLKAALGPESGPA